ncbi:MAG: MraY family glycosyltransferase [Bryobacteraceae bacterium]|jgi:UDP-GlcNAc:undecaprenyl-phosphate GlcNAc-1-phosphate transferase
MYSLLLAGLSAFILSFFLTPLLRNLCVRIGCVDRPDQLRKLHTHPIPRVGGVPIFIACVAAWGILFLSPLQGGHLARQALPLAWKLLPSFLLVFATGLCDDLFGLRPWHKFLAEFAAAALACWAGIHATFAGHPLALWWTIPLTVIWLVGCTNAFNLIDGVDGLAAGVGLFATLTTLIAALLQGNYALAIATVPLAGALLGFLRYNFNPATIFLGDSGSLSIGFLLGCYGVIWSQKSATLLGMTAPLMALSIPLLDTGIAIARRLLRGQPIFTGDRGHIHHRLLARGLTPRRVVLLLYAVCGVAATFSLLQSMMRNQYAGLVIVLFCSAAWLGIQHLGYVEFSAAGRLIVPRTFLRVLNAQLRLRTLEDALASAETIDQCWLAVRGASHDFGFQHISMRVNHTLYEESFSTADAPACWTLHVPLTDLEFVQLGHGFESQVEPMVVGSLADLLRRSLLPKLSTLQTRASAPSAPLW